MVHALLLTGFLTLRPQEHKEGCPCPVPVGVKGKLLLIMGATLNLCILRLIQLNSEHSGIQEETQKHKFLKDTKIMTQKHYCYQVLMQLPLHRGLPAACQMMPFPHSSEVRAKTSDSDQLCALGKVRDLPMSRSVPKVNDWKTMQSL